MTNGPARPSPNWLSYDLVGVRTANRKTRLPYQLPDRQINLHCFRKRIMLYSPLAPTRDEGTGPHAKDR